jgi:prevent-host-death family protein
MRHTVSVFNAKSNLSKLIELAVAGDQVVITNRGKPVAELIPHLTKTQNGYGVLSGLISTENWDEEDAAFNASFNPEKLK